MKQKSAKSKETGYSCPKCKGTSLELVVNGEISFSLVKDLNAATESRQIVPDDVRENQTEIRCKKCGVITELLQDGEPCSSDFHLTAQPVTIKIEPE